MIMFHVGSINSKFVPSKDQSFVNRAEGITSCTHQNEKKDGRTRVRKRIAEGGGSPGTADPKVTGENETRGRDFKQAGRKYAA